MLVRRVSAVAYDGGGKEQGSLGAHCAERASPSHAVKVKLELIYCTEVLKPSDGARSTLDAKAEKRDTINLPDARWSTAGIELDEAR